MGEGVIVPLAPPFSASPADAPLIYTNDRFIWIYSTNESVIRTSSQEKFVVTP